MLNINVRTELAAALCDLLSTTPITEISVRQVTQSCGLSSRTLYNYFRDKYDLMHFIYYCANEKCWFENGKPCSFERAYNRWGSCETITPAIIWNMYQYVGQNDIREFILQKTMHDLKRVFYYSDMADCLKDPELQEALDLINYGMCGWLEHLIYPKKEQALTSKSLTARAIFASVPEKYRIAFMLDPAANGPRPDIPPFDINTCEWPPKLYK